MQDCLVKTGYSTTIGMFLFNHTVEIRGLWQLPSPTTLDIILAAHILLLLNPPFPDPLLKTLLTDSYPTLVDHARLVHAEAQVSNPEIPTSPAHSYTLWSLVPQSAAKQGEKKEPKARNEEDIRFDRMRWAWIALAVGSVAFYLSTLRIRLTILNTDELKREGKEEQGEKKEKGKEGQGVKQGT